ncbi:MAG: hypothetical protein EBZ48_16595 [Proteobacteria bacterium]|nr:hypothetical protein [Pseudomonadota bacterium]
MVCGVLGLMGAGLLLWRRRIEDLYVVCLLLLFYLPAEWVKAKPEPQPERYILPCVPILALMGAELVRVVSSWRLRGLASAVLAIAVVTSATKTVRLASELKHDTRDEMAAWMRENLPPGSRVAVDWKPYAPSIKEPDFQVVYLPRASIIQELRVSRLRNAQYDYLVLSSLFYDRYFTQPHQQASLRQVFRYIYDQIPIVKELRPRYGTYGFHNPRLTLFSLKKEDLARLDQERALREAGTITQTSNQALASFKWGDVYKR